MDRFSGHRDDIELDDAERPAFDINRSASGILARLGKLGGAGASEPEWQQGCTFVRECEARRTSSSSSWPEDSPTSSDSEDPLFNQRSELPGVSNLQRAMRLMAQPSMSESSGDEALECEDHGCIDLPDHGMEPVMGKGAEESEVEIVSDARMNFGEDVAVTVLKLGAADWTSTSAQRYASTSMSINGLQLVPADCNIDSASSSEPSNGHDVPDAAESINKTSDAMAETNYMQSLEKGQDERRVEDPGIGHIADKELFEEADSASCSGATVSDTADNCVSANAGQLVVAVDHIDRTSFCAHPSSPLDVLQLVPADCNIDSASSSEPSSGHDVPDAEESSDNTSDAMVATNYMKSLEQSQDERRVEDPGIGHIAHEELFEEADSASCSGAIVSETADNCVAANAGQLVVVVDHSDCTSLCAHPSSPVKVLATRAFAPPKPAAPHGPRRRRKARHYGHAQDDDDSDNDNAGFALPEKLVPGSSSRRKCRRLCDENTPPQTQPRR